MAMYQDKLKPVVYSSTSQVGLFCNLKHLRLLSECALWMQLGIIVVVFPIKVGINNMKTEWGDNSICQKLWIIHFNLSQIKTDCSQADLYKCQSASKEASWGWTMETRMPLWTISPECEQRDILEKPTRDREIWKIWKPKDPSRTYRRQEG